MKLFINKIFQEIPCTQFFITSFLLIVISSQIVCEKSKTNKQVWQAQLNLVKDEDFRQHSVQNRFYFNNVVLYVIFLFLTWNIGNNTINDAMFEKLPKSCFRLYNHNIIHIGEIIWIRIRTSGLIKGRHPSEYGYLHIKL